MACALLDLDADALLKDRAVLGQRLETFVFQELRRLRDGTGKAFVAGIVLYDGKTSVGFGDGLWAIPIRALWEGM